MEPITNRINQLREARGLSESRLADNSQIPRTTFKRRLADPRTFTMREFERVAGALGVDPTSLWIGDAA